MTSEAIWTPSQAMAANEQHTATVTGTVQDSTGATRTVDFNAWTFKTVDNSNPNILWKDTFSQQKVNTDFTVDQVKGIFGPLSAGGSGFGKEGPQDQRAFWRADPLNSGRGAVLMMRLDKGKYSGDGAIKVQTIIDWGQAGNDSSGEIELWFAYDVFFSQVPDFKVGAGMKMMGLRFYGPAGPTAGSGGDGTRGTCMFMAHGNLPNDPSVPVATKYRYLNPGSIAPASYTYYYNQAGANVTARTRHLNTVDSTERVESSTASRQYNYKRGTWERWKMHIKMNTGDTKNGIGRWYVNNKLMWDMGGVAWRNDDIAKLKNGIFSHFHGGGDSTWRSPDNQDQEVYISNMVVSLTDPDN